METKQNYKYFTAPPVNILMIIGLAVLVIGVILVSLFSSTRVPGLIAIVVGFIAIIVASGGKSTDTDLDYQVAERIKDLQELSEKKFEVYEKSFLKMLKPMTLKGYDFEAKEESFLYMRGRDGKHRTNFFMGCNLIFTSEKIYFYGRRFSLTDDLIDNITPYSFFYNELEKAELEEKVYNTTIGKRDIEVPVYVFKILKKDGTEALRMCVEYGADTDKAIEDITRAINVRQVELEKRAKETAERRAAFREKIEAEKAADAAAAAAGEQAE